MTQEPEQERLRRQPPRPRPRRSGTDLSPVTEVGTDTSPDFTEQELAQAHGDRNRAAEARRMDAAIDRAVAAGQPVPLPSGDGLDVIARATSRSGANVTVYRREYRMRLLHRMLMRNLPLDMIAQSLNCSIRTVFRLRAELEQQFAYEARSMQLESYVGGTVAYFSEIAGMAMRIAGDNGMSPAMRLKAMNVAMQAKRDTVTFMDRIGFHDARKLVPAEDNTSPEEQEANGLAALSRFVLSGDVDSLQAMQSVHEAEALEQVDDDLFGQPGQADDDMEPLPRRFTRTTR